MAVQKAIVLQGDKKVSLVTDRPIPTLRPGYILIEVKAVALNPTDWKHVDFINTPGCVVGCDYAGIVVETGSGYQKPWKKGDRICGFVHGSNCLQKEDGAFAQYIVVKADIQIRIPKSMSFEDAATFGVAVITCGQSLYQAIGLHWPTQPSTKAEPVLIYGGSSAMGTFAIQFTKLSGYTPITTCSPRNFDLVKSLGAEAAFDYNDPDCARKIKDYTKDNLKFVMDTITSEGSLKICAEAISSGGTYNALLPAKLPRDDVESKTTMGYTAVGEPVRKVTRIYENTMEDFEWMKPFVEAVEPLILGGKFRAHPVRVGHGLEGVLDGLDKLRQGQVSGQKLVYSL